MRTHGNASSNDTFAFDDTPLSAQIQQSHEVDRGDRWKAGRREFCRCERIGTTGTLAVSPLIVLGRYRLAVGAPDRYFHSKAQSCPAPSLLRTPGRFWTTTELSEEAEGSLCHVSHVRDALLSEEWTKRKNGPEAFRRTVTIAEP